MFGFHPFATQAFSSAVPFLDVQTTTNAVTASQGTTAFAAVALPTTAGVVTSTVQPWGSEYLITVSIVEASTVLTGVMTLSSQTPSIFTYNDVDDNITEETWSEVVTTTNSESWSEA